MKGDTKLGWRSPAASAVLVIRPGFHPNVPGGRTGNKEVYQATHTGLWVLSDPVRLALPLPW